VLQHNLPQTGDATGHVPIFREIVNAFVRLLKRPPYLEAGFAVRVFKHAGFFAGQKPELDR
jgi:hypothetical protein